MSCTRNEKRKVNSLLICNEYAFSVILYGIILFMFYIIAYTKFPSPELMFLQMFVYAIWAFSFFLCSKLDFIRLITYAFIYQLSLSLLLYVYFIRYANSPFGYDANDAIYYMKITEQTIHLKFGDVFSYLMEAERGGDWSDLGFPILLRFIYILAGNVHTGIIFMIVLNVLFQTLSLFYLSKLSLFFLSNEDSRFFLMMWGGNLCSVWLNVSGLKEPFFLLLTIVAVYYLYKIYFKYSFRNLTISVAFIGLLLFFRYYVSIFFLLILMGFLFFRKILNKNIVAIMLIAMGLTIFGLSILAYFIPELKFLILLHEETTSGQHGVIFEASNILFSILGPLPAFLDTPNRINIIIGTYSCLKIVLSFWAIYGTYHILKYKEVHFYPLILLVFLNTLLTYVGGFSLDYRYTYITMPLFFILIVYGVRVSVKSLIIPRICYLFIVIVIVSLYNFRT